MTAARPAETPGGLRRDWVVSYRASSRAAVAVWAVIVGVPRELDAEAVAAALEAWPRWPQWEARRGVRGSIDVVHRTARHTLDGGTVMLEWAQLAPAGKRIGLEVPGPVWAALTRHARERGVSLNRYCTALLEAAAGADRAADGQAPALFTDVPLPLGLDEPADAS